MTQAENSRNSGPAFPATTEHGFNSGEPGMTLRDYFAAKAMQGCLTAKYASTYRPETWAKDAYVMADAMLKARAAIAEAESALAAPQPSYDDWIPWKGGECPVERRAVVMVRGKNGEVDTDKAHFYDWHHTGSSIDIVAYRVVKP